MKPNKIDYSKAIDGFINLNKIGEVMEENYCQQGKCECKFIEDVHRYANDVPELYKQLQLKDKMIELMARKLAKGGVPRFYQENRVIKDTEQQALAELEE